MGRELSILPRTSSLRKQTNSKLMKLELQARFAYAVQFFNVSFRLNLYLFSPDDIRCNKA